MLKWLEAAGWILAIAVLWRFLGYKVPFTHHLESVGVEPEVEEVEPSQHRQDPLGNEGELAQYSDYWKSLGQ
jgi:hypothetical protein